MEEMNNTGFSPIQNQQQFYNPAQNQNMNSQYQNYNQPKKNNKTCLIVGILVPTLFFLLIGIFAVVILIFVNYEKEFITANEFKNYMENQGYTIVDATYQFTDVDYIEKVYLAVDSKDNYQIEFYRFDEESQAEDFFLTNKNQFKKYDDLAKFSSSMSGKNYNKYSLATSSSYKTISQIENTAVYIDTDKENQKEVETHLEELGY